MTNVRARGTGVPIIDSTIVDRQMAPKRHLNLFGMTPDSQITGTKVLQAIDSSVRSTNCHLEGTNIDSRRFPNRFLINGSWISIETSPILWNSTRSIDLSFWAIHLIGRSWRTTSKEAFHLETRTRIHSLTPTIRAHVAIVVAKCIAAGIARFFVEESCLCNMNN